MMESPSQVTWKPLEKQIVEFGSNSGGPKIFWDLNFGPSSFFYFLQVLLKPFLIDLGNFLHNSGNDRGRPWKIGNCSPNTKTTIPNILGHANVNSNFEICFRVLFNWAQHGFLGFGKSMRRGSEKSEIVITDLRVHFPIYLDSKIWSKHFFWRAFSKWPP